jgi:hypothetical protein
MVSLERYEDQSISAIEKTNSAKKNPNFAGADCSTEKVLYSSEEENRESEPGRSPFLKKLDIELKL